MGFFSEQKGLNLWIKVPTVVDNTEIKQFEVLMSTWVASGVQGLVFDYSGTTEIPPSLYRAMGQLQALAKKSQMRCGSLGLSSALLSELKKAGVDGVFRPIKDPSELNN